MKFLTTALTAATLTAGTVAGTAALAACDDGEMVIKFSHVTNTDKHPKGIAANLLMERVNEEMNGTACMEVYPNSTLYNDDQVLEAMLQGTCSSPRRRCPSSRPSPRSSAFSTCPSCS